MKHVTFTNSSGLRLAGVYYAGKGERASKGIILCHGFASSKDRPHYVLLSKKLNSLGFSVLRFDFGGCGESETRPILVKDQVDDLSCAISFMQERGCETFGLLGNSLGGITVLSSFDESIVKSIVLWAPVTAARDEAWKKRKQSQWVKRGENYIFTKHDGTEYQIIPSFFEERLTVNQKKLCHDISCPVLIIHGNKDTTTSLTESQNAMQYFTVDSQLEVIDGAGHIFRDQEMHSAIDFTTNWFGRWM